MIRAALFDKDGTLVDFHRTWDSAVGIALRGATRSPEALSTAATLLEFDLQSNTIGPASPLIADSNQDVLDLIDAVVEIDAFVTLLNVAAADAVTPSLGVPQVLHDLRGANVDLAVVTNDFEEPAKRQLTRLGLAELFSHVVAADTGFGAKPDPGMLRGALGLCDVRPEEAIIVGDTAHDLRAGRSAGVLTVLVTNNRSPQPECLPLADLVITDLTTLRSTLEDVGLLARSC